MADSKYFGIPFASTGDRAVIPEGTDPSGAISYQQGFGPDYERNPATDPQAKRVPRDETNEYLFQITNSIKLLQLYGLPEWYDLDGAGSPVLYPLGARVRHAGKAWVSLVANNADTPGVNLLNWGPLLSGEARTRVITASGNYTPDFTGFISYELVGGGGGSLGCQANNINETTSGASGGSGGRCFGTLAVRAGVALPVTIGAAGARGTTGSATAGGNSTFAGATAGGGGGAIKAAVTSTSGGTAGTATGGDVNLPGQAGSDGQSGNFIFAANGVGPSGGRAGQAAGINATGYGSSGGGAYDTNFGGVLRQAGTSTPGVLIITEFR